MNAPPKSTFLWKSMVTMYYKEVIFGMLLIIGAIISLSSFFGWNTTEDYHDVKMSIAIPFSSLESGEDRYETKTLVIPENTYLTSFVPVISGTGSSLHHADVSYTGYADPYCARKLPFVAAIGAELKPGRFPEGYGVPVKKGRHLEVLMHIANKDTSKVASSSWEMYISGKARMRPAFPLFLSVTDYCKFGITTVEYAIPAGVTYHETAMERPFLMPKPAKLLAWSGHLHTYGSSLSLLINGRVQSTLSPSSNPSLLADSQSVYLKSVSFLEKPLELHTGDIIDLRARYVKPKDLFYPGAMGIGFLILDFGEAVEL